ncbi:MAG: hypothetical protein AB3X44_16120 [Leptothrix sp. (in: b-proteobacteria)]
MDFDTWFDGQETWASQWHAARAAWDAALTSHHAHYYCAAPASPELTEKISDAVQSGCIVDDREQAAAPAVPSELVRAARVVAEWHIEDTDDCGELARRLIALIDQVAEDGHGIVTAEPAAWLTYSALTGKPMLSEECVSELASTPLADGDIEIFGVRYSLELFKNFALAPLGTVLQIIDREHGTVTVRKLDQPAAPRLPMMMKCPACGVVSPPDMPHPGEQTHTVAMVVVSDAEDAARWRFLAENYLHININWRNGLADGLLINAGGIDHRCPDGRLLDGPEKLAYVIDQRVANIATQSPHLPEGNWRQAWPMTESEKP